MTATPAQQPAAPASAAGLRPDRDVLETAWRLHALTAAEITKSDTKAGFASAIELGGLLALGDGVAGPRGPLVWISGGCLLAAVLLACLVVLPSLGSRRADLAEERGWYYFRALRGMSGTEIAERLRQADDLDQVCRQLAALSAIAHRKSLLLRASLLLAIAGLALAALATV
ncbi:Pycsar system effector family protein [Kribbella sp. NPDC051718]|uniref:Pycsar system effector family protein n=1 Tax=Kribbella sp. NPDC051718 TaxID=3155168 RepID=UPI00342D3047